MEEPADDGVYALLADGTTALIRPASAADRDAVRAMHEAMSPDNSYLRFFRPVYVDLLPPCNAACPAGENIQAWLAAAPEEEVRQRWAIYEEMAAPGPERSPAAEGST